MASFKERYEELFGETPDYDPIELAERPKERALDIQAAVPSASPAVQAIPYRRRETAPAADQGVLANLADLTKTGTALGAEALVGGAEYIARQAARREPGVVKDVLASAAGGLEGVREQLTAYRQNIYDMMPPDAIAKKVSEFTTLDPDKTIWKVSPLVVGEAVLY